MGVPLGAVAHFSLPVADPAASAQWWSKNFDLNELFNRSNRIGIGNDSFTIVLVQGDADTEAFGHMAFRTSDVAALTRARDVLRENGVDLEDPGDEIGPVAPGSPNMGLWFRDLDGYRWELFVRAPDA